MPVLTPSRILEILGKARFARFKAFGMPGTVVWCNFELARELGFSVPPSNRMNPELHEQLIKSLSYYVPAPDDQVPSAQTNNRRTTILYADRYGGTGIGSNLGAA